ncbi:MAG: phosphoglucosamine mutase, partial [Verrucomicrobiae bacterium]|nr:phosphoglucosamine mutase [Verrucomicrobiae bacterium]
MSSSPRTLFGTDGIRGKAGLKPLDPESVMRLGMAAADVLLPGFRREATHRWPTVVIGKDTRLSGDMLEAAIAAGLNARGIDVRLAGVVPTPAVAWLTRETGAAFGVVISASHNPFDDNGIKFFDWRGIKLDDKTEAAIEAAFKGEIDPKAAEIGRTAPIKDAADRYVNFVCGLFQDHRDLFTGSRFALDAANGAASVTSAAILTHLGAKVSVFHDRPNGMNINRECGCTHPEAIESLVRETGADAGISHDGDADRVMLCDETG